MNGINTTTHKKHLSPMINTWFHEILYCMLTLNVDFLLQKCYSDFELQGVSETVLNSKMYQTICSRLQVITSLSGFYSVCVIHCDNLVSNYVTVTLCHSVSCVNYSMTSNEIFSVYL